MWGRWTLRNLGAVISDEIDERKAITELQPGQTLTGP
jgi:hypothetical protein